MSNPYRPPNPVKDGDVPPSLEAAPPTKVPSTEVRLSLHTLQAGLTIGGCVALVTLGLTLSNSVGWSTVRIYDVAAWLMVFLILAGGFVTITNIHLRKSCGSTSQRFIGQVAVVSLGLALGAMTALTLVVARGRPLVGLRALFAASVLAMLLTGISLTLLRVSLALRTHRIDQGVTWMRVAIVFFAAAATAASLQALRWQLPGSQWLLTAALTALVIAFASGCYGVSLASASLVSSSTDSSSSSESSSSASGS